MAIPKEHMRRFHGMDDAKEIWEAIRTRFGGNANSKKMQKAVFKQQFEAFKISNSEGLEKGMTVANSYFLNWKSCKSSTNKVKSGFTGAYSTCTPSTSSTNIPEKEVLADLEQIDDVDIEEMDINWQIAMIAIRMKKFYKKTGRRVRVDGKTPQRGHMRKEEEETHFITSRSRKQEKNQMGLLTMDDGIVNWGEHTEVEETNLKLWLQAQAMMVSLYSSKNLWRLIDSGMSSNKDSIGKPLYSRFTKTNDFKGVPHPLSGDYTPKPQEEIDDSLYVYGKKGPQNLKSVVQMDTILLCILPCQSNLTVKDSCGNTSSTLLRLIQKV
ncbi:hypothetical protein Tco_0822283 [Tanacetum coccineum]|uniref:Uncharacterized protein n=1 Tax=Tanacetum coccineum TaxID=301880 RepID=A0ABQ5AGF0_9ASTR